MYSRDMAAISAESARTARRSATSAIIRLRSEHVAFRVIAEEEAGVGTRPRRWQRVDYPTEAGCLAASVRQVGHREIEPDGGAFAPRRWAFELGRIDELFWDLVDHQSEVAEAER